VLEGESDDGIFEDLDCLLAFVELGDGFGYVEVKEFEIEHREVWRRGLITDGFWYGWT